MGLEVFFELEEEQKVNLIVYWNQILLELLKDFWKEVFGNVQKSIVVEDNTPVYKKVCISIRQELGVRYHQHSPNSPDLNSIENIWMYIKHIIVKKYSHITFIKEIKQVVLKIWNNFGNDRCNSLIESMSNRSRAVIAAREGREGRQHLFKVEEVSKWKIY